MGILRFFVCLFLLLLSSASFAVDNGEFTYEAYQDGISLTGCSTQCPTDLVIPSEIDGLNVLRIDRDINNNFGGQGIIKLTISENITHIGEDAFSDNPIEKLLVGPDVISIGQSAFYNNTTPPINVLFVGPRPALKGCSGCGYVNETYPFSRRPTESEFYFCDTIGWSVTSINTGTNSYGGGIQESELLTNCDLDSDADGEIDFMDDDDDNDGINDEIDAFPLLASETHDFDNDGIGDNADTDSDNDGIDDELDAFPLDPDESSDSDADGIGDNVDSFPNNPEYFLDSDSDSMPDEWELQHGMNPNDPSDAILDQDNDGKSALQEFEDGTYPVPDTDGDGIRDEIDLFPNDPAETIDTDGDGTGDNGDNCIVIGNSDQLNTDSDPFGNACDDDDDNDGIPDSYETANGLNPLDASDAQSDSDMDGLTALGEFTAGTSLTNDDTDRDTLPDGWEVENGRDPSVADYQIVSGGNHFCAIDDTGVVCWGNNDYGQANVPALDDVLYLSLHTNSSCAVTISGIKCWGLGGNYSSYRIPTFLNVSFGSGSQNSPASYCGFDNNELFCSGQIPSFLERWSTSYFKGDCILVESSQDLFCAHNGSWGTTLDGVGGHYVPVSGEFIQFDWYSAEDQGDMCTLGTDGVYCRGWGAENVPDLSNPIQVAVGYGYACALEESGVICWGVHSPGVPALSNPKQLASTNSTVCALDDTGVVCWGGEADQRNLPNLMIDPDGDGYTSKNGLDMFRLDPFDWTDFDLDGLGDNADNDDDNDGALDHLDAFPLNSSEQLDSDLDGIGNKSDADNDNDGVMNEMDFLPLDPNESADADGDGVGDNADFFPISAEYSLDSDLDQMPDTWERKFGLNPTDASDAALDHDGDGLTALEEYEAGTIPLKILDIDANGSVDALTDGLMVLRYLFGLRGQGLINGAIADNAMRTEAADVEAYIQSLMPSF